MDPLMKRVNDAVNTAANDVAAVLAYVQQNYPGDAQLLQLAQKANDDFTPLLSYSTDGPPGR